MHPVKRCFCRAVQWGFRTVQPILPYKDPERLCAVENILPTLQSHDVDSVLLVTDEVIRGSGLTRSLEQLLWRNHIRCYIYDRTEPNPTVENVEEAYAEYVRGGCKAIVSFGGGSVIDCAKAVGARVAYPKKSVVQLKGLLRVLRKTPLHIAVPTTAGSGSEGALASLITDRTAKRKYVLYDFTLIPEYAVLDPEVTYGLPKFQTATIGMDALTHAVEAYIGGTTTKQTRAYCLDAVRLIFRNIERAYNDGSDREARKNMLYASHLAGIAFSKSYVGYIHCCAHTLGGQYNTPHGLANAVLMPVVLEAYGEAVYEKLHDLAIAAGVARACDSHEMAAKRFICAIRQLNYRMEIPVGFDFICEEDIPYLAQIAAREGNPLYPVPVLMDAKELEQFYRAVMVETAYTEDRKAA